MAELARLHDEAGALNPEAVVVAAADPSSPLHDLFEWDDTAAAHQHRLNQARNLIRVAVRVIPQVNKGPVRAYVSIGTLRGTPTGSYLSTVRVLDDEDLRLQALDDALATMKGLHRRYGYLPELAPVWDALAAAIAAVEAVRSAA
ncbi:MAG: hypothetical protein SNJ79_11630 [Sphingomonadaceae bacterium]